MKIGINCGHTVDGQPGSGAIGFISEGVEDRNVGHKLMKLLRDRGVEVVDCTDDYAESEKANLAEIVRLANAQPLDLFVSLHFNSGGGHGAEVFTYGGKYMEQADRVLNNLEAVGFTNRGIKGSNLYVINHTDAPAMLIEICFVDSKSDCDLYNRLGADIIAQALCGGILGNTEELTMTQYEELNEKIERLSGEINGIAEALPQLMPTIYDYMDDNMPSWAKPTIQKLMDRDILNGNEKGELGLTYEMLRTLVMLDRAGVFDK